MRLLLKTNTAVPTNSSYAQCESETDYTVNLRRYLIVLVWMCCRRYMLAWYLTVKACFHIAQYAMLTVAQSALHFIPWQTFSIEHYLDMSGKNPIKRRD